MSQKRKVKVEKHEEWKNHCCGECANVTIVTRFHTLSVKGEPTMGECPEWTSSRCVLLSQQACKKFNDQNGKTEST